MRPAIAARRASLWFEGNGSYNDPRWLYADRQGPSVISRITLFFKQEFEWFR